MSLLNYSWECVGKHYYRIWLPVSTKIDRSGEVISRWCGTLGGLCGSLGSRFFAKLFIATRGWARL